MIEWTEKEVGPGVIFHCATAIDDKWGLRALADRLVDKVVPQNAGLGWDYVRVEIWAETGRVIVFPAQSRQPDRIEKVGVRVIFTELLEAYEGLADSEISDAHIEQRLAVVLSGWAERVADHLCDRLGEARLQREVIVYSADDEEPLLRRHVQ